MTTKLKSGVDLFNRVWENHGGVGTDPNSVQDLHKIKIEWNPILTFVEKLGGNSPFRMTVRQKDGTYRKSHAEELRSCLDMLKKRYVYPGNNLAPLKKLYCANGWSTMSVSTKNKTRDV